MRGSRLRPSREVRGAPRSLATHQRVLDSRAGRAGQGKAGSADRTLLLSAEAAAGAPPEALQQAVADIGGVEGDVQAGLHRVEQIDVVIVEAVEGQPAGGGIDGSGPTPQMRSSGDRKASAPGCPINALPATPAPLKPLIHPPNPAPTPAAHRKSSPSSAAISMASSCRCFSACALNSSPRPAVSRWSTTSMRGSIDCNM